MKQSMKKLLAAVAIIALATTSSIGAFAEYDPDKVVDPNVASTKAAAPTFTVSVNGNELANAAVYESETDHVMLPIRAVAENMGFTVGWNAGRVTLTKGAVYATFAVGEDGYTFAKTAPMTIGQAPELVNEKTYVPDSFFTELLDAELTISPSGAISISYGEEEKEEGKAVVTSIRVDEEYKYTAVLVNDEKLGEVQLNLGDESNIVLADGSKGKAADLKEGMKLDIEYSEAMTMSLPPQNSPVKVTVLAENETVEPEKATGNAKITKMEEGSVVVEDEKLGEVVLHIGDDTKIILLDGKEGSVKDLKAEMDIVVEYGAAMTASLPPQNTPVKITVVERSEENKEEGVSIKGEITEVHEAAGEGNFACTVKAEKTEKNAFEEIVLIVSDDTKITKDGKEAGKEDLKEGVKIEAVHSLVMTRSLPPQTSAISINIVD